MANKKPTPSLENQLEALETILDKMEDEELPLETALAEFEKGIQLISSCQKILQETEQKVQILTEKMGKISLDDYDDDLDDE
ncbi:MAG: exodeoxyribonuclease VII small subunit [Gammaproteobacteria bacterium]